MIKVDNVSYKQLKAHENVLAAAYKGDYLNAPYTTVKAIYDIAVRIGYNGRPNFTCTRCRLTMLKEIGKAYFDFKQKLSDSAAKAREAKAEKERLKSEPINEPISELISEPINE